MRRAFHKIAAGLREALAIIRGAKEPARVTVFTPCADGCGNVTRTIDGRCDLCWTKKPGALAAP